MGEICGVVGEGVAEGVPVSVVRSAEVAEGGGVVGCGVGWAGRRRAVFPGVDVLGEAFSGFLGVGAWERMWEMARPPLKTAMASVHAFQRSALMPPRALERRSGVVAVR